MVSPQIAVKTCQQQTAPYDQKDAGTHHQHQYPPQGKNGLPELPTLGFEQLDQSNDEIRETIQRRCPISMILANKNPIPKAVAKLARGCSTILASVLATYSRLWPRTSSKRFLTSSNFSFVLANQTRSDSTSQNPT